MNPAVAETLPFGNAPGTLKSPILFPGAELRGIPMSSTRRALPEVQSATVPASSHTRILPCVADAMHEVNRTVRRTETLFLLLYSLLYANKG